MLRTSSRLKLLTVALLIPSGLVLAQQQMPAQPGQQPGQQQTQQQPAQRTQQQTQPQQRPSQQPPQLERIEPGSDAPATTIPPKEGTRITEKRDNRGVVTDVEVQAGPSRYSLKPNTPVGNAQPGDVLGRSERGPQWQVMEFDFGNPKKKDTAEQPVSPAPARAGVPARADVPPPPPLEPVEKK